jgi:hypothetical protein
MIGLPFLDAMVPAGPGARGARAALDRARLIAIEIVHGAAGSNEWGASQNLWAPAQVGSGFDLGNPSALSPLEPFRDYLTVVSNTDCRMAEAFDPKEIGGDHFRTSAVFLTQAHPKQTESSDLYVGMSLDQMFARRFGQETAIPSMQLCIENVDQAGGCGYGYSCAYTDSISWASPVEPLPMIRDPRAAFEQLFGGGGTPEERVSRRRAQRSILDMITAEVAALKRQLDGPDVQRLDQYMDNVRELERRIQSVETQNASGEPRELPEAPLGVPDSFGEHMRLMLDLQASAFAADMTRVFTFKLSRDASGRVYPESGTETAFHPASHHGGKSAAVLDFNIINRYHVGFLPYLLEKLESTTEGDGHLLDKTMIIYGSAMGDSNLHNHKRCPLIAVGGPGGRVPGGLHLKAPDGTPMANAMLGMLHRLGFDELESFGDSSGVLASAPNVSEM